MADPSGLIDPNVKDPGPADELVVDREGLALSEGARDAGDSDSVRCRVVRSRPDNLVDTEFLRVELRDPVFPVGRVVIGAGVGVAGDFEVGEDFLLGSDILASLDLFGELSTHVQYLI